MNYGFGFGTKGGSGGGSGTAFKNQRFTATDGQTLFTVTLLTLTDNCMVYIDGVLVANELYTRSGNDITFDYGLNEGTEVVIAN